MRPIAGVVFPALCQLTPEAGPDAPTFFQTMRAWLAAVGTIAKAYIVQPPAQLHAAWLGRDIMY